MTWRFELGFVLCCILSPQLHSETFKYVDERGVTFYSNEPPAKVAPQPAASKPEVTVPATPASAPVPGSKGPAAVPLNPEKALGDWPPKSITFEK
jgi:hypothetical protein